MVKARTDQTSFQAGELSPEAIGRQDAKSYYQGAAKAENVYPLITGGLMRRPGSGWLEDLPRTDGGFMAEFIFSDDQVYLFVFQHSLVRIYQNGAFVQQLSTPWAAALLPKLGYAQRGDTMFLTHKDVPTQTIQRTGATSFVCTGMVFDTDTASFGGYKTLMPFYKFAATSTTLTPSSAAAAGTAGVTFTIGGPGAGTGVSMFTPAHAGTYLRYKGKQVVINTYNSPTVVTGTVIETLPSAAADLDWDEQAFSAVHGYARTCCFHEDRLWLCGSRDYPAGFWGSKSSKYYNFDQGVSNDGDSVWSGIGGELAAEIRSAVSYRNLLLFTDVGEFYLPTAANKPITPTTVSVRRQTNYGSASIRPQPFDGAVAFVQKTGSSMREFMFSELEQAYNAFSISSLASHLIIDPVSMTVVSGSKGGRPEQLLFVVMSDGSIAILHSNRAENFTGWFPWRTQGLYKAVRAVLDQVYAIVERTVNGVTVWSLEVFDFTYYLDRSVRTSGAALSTFPTAGAHLKTTPSYAVTGYLSLGAVTPDGAGSVSIDPTTPQTTIDIGLIFQPTIIPLPLASQSGQGGTSGGGILAQPRRVAKMTLQVKDTLRCLVDGNPLLFRQGGEDFSLQPVPKTGRFEFRLLGWDKLGQKTITQDEPGPLTVLSFELESIIS